MPALNSTDFSLPMRGHNQPPSDVALLSERLALAHVSLIRQAEEHIALAEQIPGEFTQEVEATFTSDFIKKIQVCFKALEKERATEKEPFLRQGQFVDTFFGDLKKKLQAAENKAMAPLNGWLTRQAQLEQKRRHEEAEALRKEQEAATEALANMQQSALPAAQVNDAVDNAMMFKQAAEVAQTVAVAPVETMAKAAGKFSAAGLRKVWRGKITNIDTLDLHKLRPYIGAAELQKALDRYVKQGGRQCEGADIVEEMEARVK